MTQKQSSIAERALIAYEAKQEETRLNTEAAIVALRASAVNSIFLTAETFDLEIDVDDIEPAACSASITSPIGAAWWIIVDVDDDLGLKIAWSRNARGEGEVEVTAQYPDQLYWDLQPGTEKMESRGGTYGNYGLNKSYGGNKVGDLAGLGKQIIKVREARAKWRTKWKVDQ